MPLPEDVVADDPRYASEHPSHHNQIHAAINDLEALAGTLSDVETTAGSQGKVDTHALDTTSVHGISDTAQLPAKNAANTFTQTQTLNLDLHVKGPTAPWADVKAYGAVGDGVADDTAAIQLAIDAVKTTVGALRGGTVFFPKGIYKCTASLNCEQGHGIVLRGVGSQTSRSIKSSVLMFTGTGSGRFIDARSAHGFEIRGMHVRYNNTGFTGTLIDFGHSIAQDNAFGMIDKCMIGGDGALTASVLVRLHEAIFTTIQNSLLQQGVVGVRCRDDTVGGYSNAHLIHNCAFEHLTLAGITNAAEKLTVTSCSFEGTTAGVSSGMPHAYTDVNLDPDGLQYAVSFIGCWFGDVVNANTIWIDTYRQFVGLSLIGNVITSAGPGLPNVRFSSTKSGWGYTIQGNSFGAAIGIDFGTQPKEGMVVSGNSFHFCTTAFANLTSVAHINATVFGNRAPLATGVQATYFSHPIDVPALRRNTDTARVILWGSGTPESVVTASVGSLFLRTDGGAATTLYVKETGTGNTGWAAPGGGGGGATLGANTFTGTQTLPASTLVGAVGVSSEGGMRIGGDTYLFRSEAAGLTTQNKFRVGDDCYIRVNNSPDSVAIGTVGPSSAMGLVFGASSGPVNLYRAAADVLKTDDKLITVVGLGVGNSAAATTPGSVVKKMEVFDAAGASLGFIPIYSTIT